MFNDLMWEVVVRFVDIGGIDDHHRLNFLFINRTSFGPTFVFRIDRCLVYTGYFNRNFCFETYLVRKTWKFGLYKISFYSGFSLDRFHCTRINKKGLLQELYCTSIDIAINNLQWTLFINNRGRTLLGE